MCGLRPGIPEIVAFGQVDTWLLGIRPDSIGLWRWAGFQEGPDRYTHWLLKAHAGELPGAYRDERGKWMVALDWELIDEIGLAPALRRLGWTTAKGQEPGKAPGTAAAGSGRVP